MHREWPLLIALLSAPAAAGESYDPAYVDSAQSKAAPDPARADATAASPAQAQLQAQLQAQYAERQYAAQQQAQAERQIAAQMEKFSAAHAAALNQQQPSGATTAGGAYVDPPVGGRNLADELSAGGIQLRTQPPKPVAMQATPARQLGSALLQDAAGVVDGRIRRQIDGPGDRILLPQQPAAPERTPGW